MRGQFETDEYYPWTIQPVDSGWIPRNLLTSEQGPIIEDFGEAEKWVEIELCHPQNADVS